MEVSLHVHKSWNCTSTRPPVFTLALVLDPSTMYTVSELHSAARGSDWTRVTELARAHPGHEALRERRGSNGMTVLHIASLVGATHACEALIEGGAHVDARNTRGSTPLHLAALHGHEPCVKVLLAAKAKIVTNGLGKNALHEAAWGGHYDTLSTILLAIDARASNVLDEFGSDGTTVMHLAALSHDPRLVVALVNAGASCDLTDSRGRTPLDFARDLGRISGDSRTAKALEKAVAVKEVADGVKHST